ncbi:MAG: efflux RND transporter periplasmic adaptor subunit [Beijerinckiaceae bacterium]|nr:efflux RND transporter periplasmic adaptor subunit [Beijerinckiaceae bacterium]
MLPFIHGFLLALALCASPTLVHAHEGHDHGPAQPEQQTVAAPRAEAQSDDFELVAIARDGGLTIYLDRFRTNEPVTGASIELETPEGPKIASPADDRYRLDAEWAVKPGRHDLLFTVAYDGAVDILTTTLVIPSPPAATAQALGPMARIWAHLASSSTTAAPVLAIAGFAFLSGLGVAVVVGGRKRTLAVVGFVAVVATGLLASGAVAQPADAPAIRDVARRLPDGAVFMPKQAQRLLEVRTQFTQAADHAATVQLPGRVIVDPNASGYVQAAVSGRLSAPRGGFPRLGARVKEGDIVAYVTPPLSAAETSDQRQRQGELDQQISLIQQRIARFEKLVGSGAVARVQLDEARIELDAIRDRRAALEQMRREPEALVAPVSGFVAAANAITGQIADANAIIFQIVDPRQLWVEAQSLEALMDVSSAEARTVEGRIFPLVFRGAGLADRSQFLPVHFALPEGQVSLRIGQLVTVIVQTGEATKGMAAPRAAVIAGENGQSIVFEHVRAERFERREVRAMPLDSGRMLISAGVAPGRRIVVQGAELLNQVR